MKDYKYKKLRDFLEKTPAHIVEISLSFSQVEIIINEKLPTTAFNTEVWWSNNRQNHTQCNSWLDAGFIVKEKSQKNQNIVFIKINQQTTSSC